VPSSGGWQPVIISKAFNLQGSINMDIVKILLAIFLPPVAAFMQVGVSLHFWINIILTLLGGLPGMVHALWLVVTKK
jgi:uncharacterized membrane protein YqaE (UPF0057 family)